MPSLDELLHEIKRIEKSREVLTEEKIRAIYRSLIDDLEQYLSKTYKQYADDEGRLYVHYLDSKNKRAKFLQEIAANVDTLSVPLKAHITKLVNSTYEETYKGMINAFKQAEDITQFAKLTKDIDVNPRVLKQAINNNISKLTLPPVLEKHRNELVYQMQQELNVGLMNGDRYETMAKRISERCNVSYNKAMNITRTETHRNVESGFMDGAEYIQENLDGSGMIYAAIWRTMKDERVRPWKRVKTKHGWKIIKKETGANHRKMEGVTVKAGELFDLGGGVKAKAPSQSGVAAHDCRCRCFLEYKMMTAEEFAAATGKPLEKVVQETAPKQTEEKDIFETEDVNTLFLENITDYDVSTTPKRRALAKQTLKELNLEDIPVSVKKANAHGYCSIDMRSGTSDVQQFVLNSADARPDVYKVKTMFHESYHAQAHGRSCDFKSIGRDAWTDVEEVFAETSSHYVLKRAGFKETLSPSYADKLVRQLPKMKQLEEFKNFSTVYEFGRYGWAIRRNGGDAVWKSLYNRIEEINLDWQKYAIEHYQKYMDDNIDDLLDSVMDNMPQYRWLKNQFKKDYKNAVQKIADGKDLSSNENTVFANIVATTMMRVGIK